LFDLKPNGTAVILVDVNERKGRGTPKREIGMQMSRKSPKLNLT